MARAAAAALAELVVGSIDESSWLDCDHNHVAVEPHGDRQLIVHRKGALPAAAGAAGLVPGSMGTVSFHTVGRGHPESLRSSSHGAGRLVDEAPTAYRDIRAVMRAQRELTAVRRELRPLVSHKAT